MAHILAITNQKGGVGKTTTAINLAASLAAAEVPTLLVDTDPQSNATSGIGFPLNEPRLGLYSLLQGDAEAAACCHPTCIQGLDLLPGSRDLVALNLDWVAIEDRELQLRRALEPLRQRYQFLVVDCPPALDLITLNALSAADGLIIPMQCEYFALEGLSQLLQTVAAVQQNWNPTLAIEGVLYTLYDERTNLSRQVAENLKAHFGDIVFRTSVPRNIRLAEAPSFGKPVLAYDLRSKGTEAYLQLAQEVLQREQQRQRNAPTQSTGARA